MKIAIEILKRELNTAKDDLTTYSHMLRTERKEVSSDGMIQYFKDNVKKAKDTIQSIKKAIEFLRELP